MQPFTGHYSCIHKYSYFLRHICTLFSHSPYICLRLELCKKTVSGLWNTVAIPVGYVSPECIATEPKFRSANPKSVMQANWGYISFLNDSSTASWLEQFKIRWSGLTNIHVRYILHIFHLFQWTEYFADLFPECINICWWYTRNHVMQTFSKLKATPFQTLRSLAGRLLKHCKQFLECSNSDYQKKNFDHCRWIQITVFSLLICVAKWQP